MLAVLGVIDIILNLAVFVLIAQAILSWLIAFGVVNSSNQFVSTVLQITHQLTEPALRPIRRRLPPMRRLLPPMHGDVPAKGACSANGPRHSY